MVTTFNIHAHPVFYDRRVSTDDQALLGGLLYVGYGSPVIHASNEAIAEGSGLSVAKVRRCLDRVEQLGHITRETFSPTRECMTGRAIHLRWLEDPAYLESVEMRPRCIHRTVGRPADTQKGCASVRSPYPKGLRTRAQEGCAKPAERVAHPCAANELPLERTQKTPPNPPMGGEPEGGGSISSPGKAEDLGTGARSSDSRPSPQSAQQTPPVPPAPPESKADIGQAAARVALKRCPEAVREEVALALRRWARKESRGGASDERILASARHGVKVVPHDVSNLAGRVVGAARAKLADLSEALPVPGPKGEDRSFRQLESEERQELEQEAAKVDYHLRGESIGREGETHRDAVEFLGRSGLSHDQLKVTARVLYELNRRKRGNIWASLTNVYGDLARRAFLDLAWAEWDLSRGQDDLAKQRLARLEDDVESEMRRRTEGWYRKQEGQEEPLSQWSPEGYRLAKEMHAAAKAAKPAPGPYDEEEDDRNPIPVNRLWDVAPQPPAPPPPPPAPMDHLERAKANAERLVDFRRSGGVPIADVLPIAIPQAATA